MKKLTAGIFTVLMGLVSVNAADAAVASKGYVDKQVSEAKAYAASEAKTLADTSVKANTEAIAAINNTETGILKTAQTYADGKVQELANGSVKANTDAIAAINNADNGILKQAKDYTDGKTGDVSSLATDADLKVVKGVSDLTAAVKKLDDAVAIASGDLGKLGALATLNTVGTGQIDNNAVTADKLAGDSVTTAKIADSNVTEAKLDTTLAKKINDTSSLSQANKQAIDAMTSEENGFLSQAKEYTDGAIEALDLKAISKVPAACSNATNYCVLTTNGTKFVWEVIARDGETETTPGTGEGYTDTGVTVPETEKTTVTQ